MAVLQKLDSLAFPHWLPQLLAALHCHEVHVQSIQHVSRGSEHLTSGCNAHCKMWDGCAGPKTPWSADWVTAFFSPGRSTLRRQRPGSISPTRLFDFNCNGDNTLPEPEDLFKTAWQGQAK